MRRPTSTPPELPGYTFDKVLGSGGFSDVFLYEQKLPKRRVAVKVLLTEELTVSNRAAFVAEANLMAQLSAHPYIVTIYHADVASDDRPYFVMEYCSGPSLGERYKREVFPVADALRTGVRLASAVATAHSAGILHRDIKPANVLTNDFGWPALTDFGISSAVDEEALPIQTTTLSKGGADTMGGTESQSIGMSIPWSPPEMFEDDPKPDVRSDVFSLAATIYTILAGQTPFEVRGRSNGALDLIGRIERGAVTPMDRTDLPPSLIPVLMKGMASDRRDRFQSAVDFARALQRVELELGYSPTTIDVPNLLVAAPERQGEPDAADETRARGVSTINAQPVSAPVAPTIQPRPPVTPASADATQVRGATRVDAQPPLAPSHQVGAEPPMETVIRRVEAPVVAPQPRRTSTRTRRIIGWTAGAVAVVVAAAVVTGIVLGGGTDQDPVASPKPTGGSAVIEGAPTPTLTSAVANGSTVVFTVANPKPQKGDFFTWHRTDRTGDEPFVKTNGTITVDGYTPGATVCIEVSINRDAQGSADPLDTCYPK